MRSPPVPSIAKETGRCAPLLLLEITVSIHSIYGLCHLFRLWHRLRMISAIEERQFCVSFKPGQGFHLVESQAFSKLACSTTIYSKSGLYMLSITSVFNDNTIYYKAVALQVDEARPSSTRSQNHRRAHRNRCPRPNV